MLLDGGISVELLTAAKKNPLFFRLLVMEYQRKVATEVAKWNYTKLARIDADKLSQELRQKFYALESSTFSAVEHGLQGLDYEPATPAVYDKATENAKALALWEDNFGKLSSPETSRKLDELVLRLQARRRAAKANK
jgi:hypothetical protein